MAIPFSELRGHGEIQFPLGLSRRTVFAGPYRCALSARAIYPEVLGIKLAPEVEGEHDLLVPVRDYGVPESVGEVRHALMCALNALAKGQAVYVGCMGGIGRTGLFLSLLAKTLGIRNPLAYVRANYLRHAVETAQQERYIEDFEVSPALWHAAVRAKLYAGYVDMAKLFSLPLAF